MFAKSGIGKTSLLNAGVIPLLPAENIFPIKVRFQSTDYAPLINIIEELRPYFNADHLNTYTDGKNISLWQYLKACDFGGATPLLVFDQFEEYFNHDAAVRMQCTHQLADLINDRLPDAVQQQLRAIPRRERTPEQLQWFSPLDAKILFQIRSDKLHLMDEMTTPIPSILKHRYHLKPLQKAQAMNAIVQPAAIDDPQLATAPFTYTDITLHQMTDHLSNAQGEIESFQLQILCGEIERQVKQRQRQPQSAAPSPVTVTPDYLGGKAGINKILNNYYEDRIAELGDGDDQYIARKLIEEELIADGKRVGVAAEKVQLSPALREKLLLSRIMRVSNTHLGKSYEISHDTLVEPILKSYERRKIEEDKRQKEIELAEERRKKRRALSIALLGVLLAAGAIVLALWAIGQQQLAEEKTTEALRSDSLAQIEKQKALNALAEAERQKAFAESQQREAETQRQLAEDNLNEAQRQKDFAESQQREAEIQRQLAEENLNEAQRQKLLAEAEKEKAIQAGIEAENQKALALIKSQELEQQTTALEAEQAQNRKIINAFYFYNDSLALAYKDIWGYGFINKKGDAVIDYQYDKAEQFDATGYAKVQKDGVDYLIDMSNTRYKVAYTIEDLNAGTEALDIRNTKLRRFPDIAFTFTQLKILISNEDIDRVQKEIGQLNNLQTLDLSETQITEIPPQIGQLKNLKSLDLGGGIVGQTPIKKLPVEIGQLNNLQTLNLSGTQITEIPPQIGQLKNLQYLNLSRTQITEIPPQIGQLKNLQYLNLSWAQITEIPPQIGQLKNLQYLNLSRTQITEIPPQIGQLKNLKSLDLGGDIFRQTSIKKLPVEIGQLNNLQYLNLPWAQITEIPPQIGQLKNLQYLNLSWAQITEIPPQIGQLKNLQYLNLSRTQITEIPPQIGQLKNLQYLNLSRTQITEIPPQIGQLKNLQYLNLSWAQITEIPPQIGQLNNLQTLDLSGTQITEIPPQISQLNNLQTLDLSGTQITEIPPQISQLKNLQTLYLSKTQITEIPPQIGQLNNLRTLYLSWTQITEIPPQIGQLNNLQTLDLSGTQIPKEDIEALRKKMPWCRIVY